VTSSANIKALGKRVMDSGGDVAMGLGWDKSKAWSTN
jgi:hypothetical protein